MTTLSWLHLSDLHLKDNPASEQRRQLESLLDDIRDSCYRERLTVDAVFFSGDIAFSGYDEQYKMATMWLDKVLEACGLAGQRERLFVVPGNHDVDRRHTGQTRIKDRYEDLVEELLNPDRPYDEVNEFLGNELERQWVFLKFQGFSEFVNQYFASPTIKFDQRRYYSTRSIVKDGCTVVVLGLNSAWLSYKDNEQGRLLLGERQVCDALQEAEDRYGGAALRIALVHHPLYWMSEKDIHVVQRHLSERCSVVLRGHLHCPSVSLHSTPGSRVLELASGASLGGTYHAYNLVRVDLENGRGTAILRLQHPLFGSKWGGDEFTYRHAQQGKIKFKLDLCGGATH